MMGTEATTSGSGRSGESVLGGTIFSVSDILKGSPPSPAATSAAPSEAAGKPQSWISGAAEPPTAETATLASWEASPGAATGLSWSAQAPPAAEEARGPDRTSEPGGGAMEGKLASELRGTLRALARREPETLSLLAEISRLLEDESARTRWRRL